MRKFAGIMLGLTLLLGAAGAADAWHITGCVICDTNNNGQFDSADLPLGGVGIRVEGPSYVGTLTTDGNGKYFMQLPDVPANYVAELMPETLPSDAVAIPGLTVPFATTDASNELTQNWLIQSATCQNLGCWLTGGGVKFEPVTKTNLAEGGVKITFGGNVNPSCDPRPGQGGNWNHVDHQLDLHFQGTAIPTTRCGNVGGIPPGSTSPVTPFNFIEFRGTGTLKGIGGNKFGPIAVHFFARAEDRNEPGSNGAKDGAQIDRYFLHVFTDPNDPVGTTVYLFDDGGNPANPVPIPISGGNLQLHISSCDNPPLL
jgi:hypothetical protein